MAAAVPGCSGRQLLSWHQASLARASVQQVAALQPVAAGGLQIKIQRPQLQSFQTAECVLSIPLSSSFSSRHSLCFATRGPLKPAPTKLACLVAVFAAWSWSRHSAVEPPSVARHHGIMPHSNILLAIGAA